MKYLYDYFLELALTATVALGTFVFILIRKAFTNEKVIEAVKKDNKQSQELFKSEIAHLRSEMANNNKHSDEKMTLMRGEIKEMRRYLLDQNKS